MIILVFLRRIVLLFVYAAAAITDASHHKVYNSLIIFGAAAIAVIHYFSPPHIDAVELVYIAAFILLLLLFYSRRMLGAADVKLYMLLAFACPDSTGVLIIAVSVIIGAGCALCLLVSGMLGFVITEGRQLKLPMGIFIFSSAALVLTGSSILV